MTVPACSTILIRTGPPPSIMVSGTQPAASRKAAASATPSSSPHEWPRPRTARGPHIVLGAGDQHILEAIAAHLPETVGPVTAIAGGRAPDGLDDHLSAGISAALDEITGAAIDAIGNLVSSLAEGPSPAAVRGIKAVAQQLAEQQVAVLLVSADAARDAAVGSSYRIGGRPTEFLVDESDTGVEVPLDDGLVWAAVHQDAIVVQLPDRSGPLAGGPAAALLRRGSAGLSGSRNTARWRG